MVRTLASENAAYGITANAILPGLVATEQVLAMPEEVRERVLAALPERAARGAGGDRRRGGASWPARRRPRSAASRSLIDGAASLTQLSLGSSGR